MRPQRGADPLLYVRPAGKMRPRPEDMKDESHGNRDAAPAATAPETIDQFLYFALYPASPAMTKLCQSRLKLLVLWEKDGLTVSGLGARVWLDSGTLSQLLKRPEQTGVICRQRDTQHDKRRVLIFLTEQGREDNGRRRTGGYGVGNRHGL